MLVGVRASYDIAAGISLLAGLMAILIGDRREKAPAIDSRTESGVSQAPPSRLRFVAAGAGALGLGLEVLWTLLFAQILHNSVYSFTAVAIVFLLAISVGAAIAASLMHRIAPPALAATALLLAAGATVGGLWLFVYWTEGLAYFGMRSGLVEYLLRITIMAVVLIGVR